MIDAVERRERRKEPERSSPNRRDLSSRRCSRYIVPAAAAVANAAMPTKLSAMCANSQTPRAPSADAPGVRPMMFAQIVGIAASGAATSVRLTSRASSFDDEQREREHEPGERQRRPEPGERHRAGLQAEREQRDGVRDDAERKHTRRQPRRAPHRTRERHRGKSRGAEVAGDGDEMGDRDHGTRPNLLRDHSLRDLCRHARRGAFLDLRLLLAGDDRRGAVRRDAQHLRPRDEHLGQSRASCPSAGRWRGWYSSI